MKLVLIETVYKKYYWNIDETGIYADSIDYETEGHAIGALLHTKILWEFKKIEKSLWDN